MGKRSSHKMLCSVFGGDVKTSICIDCKGKGFMLSLGKTRHTRKCPKCKGVGAFTVGSTKR